MEQIIHNSFKTPDGTILVSRSVHDYNCHTDKNGDIYCIDGGREYLHWTLHHGEFEQESLVLYEGDSHEKIREVFTWGTYGKMGDQPIRFVELKNLTDEHIEAILDTQSHMPQYMRNLFIEESAYRINNIEARISDASKDTTDSV